jgi:chemotaxis protein methyltransferase CheR
LLELRRVLTIEPMNAEAYLLKGHIYIRRGDQETAISALKTAIFWDAKLIDAHILLGRIFLERNDRAQAMTYARSAMQIDPNNQEAIGLQRQVETGGK